MRKYTIITWMTIAIIVCLQGCYVSLQYEEYITGTLTKMGEELQIAIDREYDQRQKYRQGLKTNGDQKFTYSRIKKGEEELKKAEAMEGWRSYETETINMDRLRELGIASTTQEVMCILSQDFNEEDGFPLNLDSLRNIYKVEIGNEDSDCAVLLLDSVKNPIKMVGEYDGGYYATKDICVSLKNPRFVRAMVDIPVSDFIFKSILSLLLSVLFSAVAMASVAFQLRIIRQKEELLEKRELTINGTIHDLKAPLNSAVALLGFLEQKITDESIRTLVGKAADRIRPLICDIEALLVIARRDGQRKKIALQLSEINLREIAEKAKRDVDVTFGDKPHTIEISGEATAKVDRMYMENAVRNLVENAVKYADDGVCVKVTIGDNGGETTLSVKDNGWGIPRKSISRLFDQFYRVPREDAPRGYGIGLALVKAIVEAHGGRIKVVSEEGKGSVFSFGIPH